MFFLQKLTKEKNKLQITNCDCLMKTSIMYSILIFF